MQRTASTSLDLRDDLRPHFLGDDAFEGLLSLQGQIHRQHKERKTQSFVREGRRYFIKTHGGVGWKEIFKNLFYLRLPVLGAKNELCAIQRVRDLGVDSLQVAGFGQRGRNPARLQSFLITDALEDCVSLETFCRMWEDNPPAVDLKHALIERVALIARCLHENGVNHRDFYLCHFMFDPQSVVAPYKSDGLRLYLIDLHRAQIRRSTPRRWIIKDLAGLLFSSMEFGLTQRDLFRFMTIYRGKPLKEILSSEGPFWRRVECRATALFCKINRSRFQ